MSTRSLIVVIGEDTYNGNRITRLYKHSDGYPTGNLPIIRDAIAKSQAECAADALRWEGKETTEIRQGHLVGNVIGCAVSVYGMGAVIDTYESDEAQYYAPKLKREHLGNQGDLEWIYVIDIKTKSVNIFNGSQTNVIKNKLENPENYCKCLYEEYRADEIKETRDLIKSIQDLGYSVNKKLTIVKKKGA